jgi:hypothetical protein
MPHFYHHLLHPNHPKKANYDLSEHDPLDILQQYRNSSFPEVLHEEYLEPSFGGLFPQNDTFL